MSVNEEQVKWYVANARPNLIVALFEDVRWVLHTSMQPRSTWSRTVADLGIIHTKVPMYQQCIVVPFTPLSTASCVLSTKI